MHVDVSLHTLFAGALYVTTQHLLNMFDPSRKDRAAIGNGSKSAIRKASRSGKGRGAGGKG